MKHLVFITRQEQIRNAIIITVLGLGCLLFGAGFIGLQSQHIAQGNDLEATKAKLAQAELAVKVISAREAEGRAQGMVTGMEMACGN